MKSKISKRFPSPQAASEIRIPCRPLVLLIKQISPGKWSAGFKHGRQDARHIFTGQYDIELTPRYPLRARDKAAWGGNTADARARVNPNDPLRAQPTLLLGSSSAHFLYFQDFSHFHHSGGARGRVSMPHRYTDRHTEQEPSVSDLCSHNPRGWTVNEKEERGAGLACPVVSPPTPPSPQCLEEFSPFSTMNGPPVARPRCT